jgi:hypothetical protein
MTMETAITQVEAEWPSQDYIPTEKLLNHILGCGSGEKMSSSLGSGDASLRKELPTKDPRIAVLASSESEPNTWVLRMLPPNAVPGQAAAQRMASSWEGLSNIGLPLCIKA